MHENLNCEDFLMAKMAQELDGEETGISAAQIHAHLDACENCFLEFARIVATDNLLKTQARLEPENVDLWSAIETQIKPAARQTNWQPFLLLGIFLAAYKLLEMLPENDFGFWFKVVPLALFVAVFVLLKENPFKINTELMMEK